jgi:hypothetical protein
VIRSVTGLAVLLTLLGCGSTAIAEVSSAHSILPTVDEPTALPATLAAESCQVIDGRADRRCTPGAINPDVTQDNIHSTICAAGWTDKVQPGVGYLAPLKLRQMREFGETGLPQSYKEDHLIPLSIGGAPTDPKNLFPQPTAKTTEKEELEENLHRAVCAHQMTLAAAQTKMRHDWTH